uniref:ATP synthase complex subunit 8 n=1 Tax=Eratyrus mucronatus TaxID=162367 RepID=A0A7D7IW01_9HEMI|nr:ATP synthase F0 subunit 8 [Eratyrus mucronatus]
MPHMAPTWWTTLFTIFFMSFMIILFIIYFQTYNLPETNKSNKIIQSSMNWKW